MRESMPAQAFRDRLPQRQLNGQMIEPRFLPYPNGRERFRSFVVGYKDSDLWIGVDPRHYSAAMPQFASGKLIELRKTLEAYIVLHPDFGASLQPIDLLSGAPAIALEMARAGKIAGTGPMAAVAGAFAEYIGKAVAREFGTEEIVVENGGDLFLQLNQPMTLAVYAGNSELTGKIGVEIPAEKTPLGVCTSAGTVGPSLSFGKADAVMIACTNTALADAFATAIGNHIKTASDIEAGLTLTENNPEILSLLIVCENKVGAKGSFPLRAIRRN